MLIVTVSDIQATTVTGPGGSHWYCDSSYQNVVCETTVNVGDTVSPAIEQATAPPEEGGYLLVETGISASFEKLVDFAMIPGSNDGLVLTQDGYIYRTPLDGSGPPALFADMSVIVLFDPNQSEEGLLTILFHPDYPTEPYVYIYYNAQPEPSCGCWWLARLSRFEVDLENNVLDLASEQIILHFPDPAQTHNGAGPIGFGSDGYLYASFGDGGLFQEDNAQDTSNLFGTVIRIDVLNAPAGEPYGVPADNPFTQDAEALDEIWAYGLRNPWRGAIDPVSGELWVGDVGDGQWDEIDKIVPGGNYGWPIMEGNVCWEKVVPCEPPPPDHVAPNVAIPTGSTDECAVIGGEVYRGSEMPELQGWFIYSDFCSGRVWGLDIADESATPVMLVDMRTDGGAPDPMMVSSIGLLPGGEIAIVSYGLNEPSEGIFKLISAADTDGDSLPDSIDNCPLQVNADQDDADSDGAGDACDTGDTDGDLLADNTEYFCGSPPNDGSKIPERVDGTFASVDDDGDTQVDEPLPPAAQGFDCDGDGFIGSTEEHVYEGLTDRDQDPCGNDGWPADLVGTGTSENKITLNDVVSFVFPAPGKLNTTPADANWDQRYDLVPDGTINLNDIVALVFGPNAYPPMLEGAQAFNGPECPWPP